MKLTSITLYSASRVLLSNPGSIPLLDVVSGVITRRQQLGYAETVSLNFESTATPVTTVEGDGKMFFRRRRILRFTYDDASFKEFRITDFSRDVTGQREASLSAESLVETDLASLAPIQNLTGSGVDAVSTSISLTGLTPQLSLDTLLSSDFNPPDIVEAGTVDAAIVTTLVDIQSDGEQKFIDLLRDLALQSKDSSGNPSEIKFEYNSGTGKYRVHLVPQVGWTAAEETAGVPDPTTRPVELGPGKEGNRVELIRRSDDRDYFSRITPLGGNAEETVTIGEAFWNVSNAVYSSPDTTLTIDDDPIFVDDALIGKYVGNDATGFFIITDTTSPGTVVVTGNAAALNGSDVRFAEDSSGRWMISLDHPDASDGAVEYRKRYSEIAPFENLAAEAGLSADFSSFVGSVPVGWNVQGSPTTTQNTTSKRYAYGISSVYVGADTGEGLYSDDITIAPTASRPWFSSWIHLTVTSGSIKIEFEDANGTIHPNGKTLSSTSTDLAAFKIEGMDPVAGALVVRITAIEDGTVFYLDAITLTQSAAAYSYSEEMGPRGLWKAAASELVSSAALYSDTYESTFWDVKELNIGSYNRVELGSHVSVKDAYNGSSFDIDFTARIVEIEIDEDPIAGSYNKRARFARRKKDFTDRYAPGKNGRRTSLTIPGSDTLPSLLSADLHIDANSDLIVSWNGDSRTDGVYVNVDINVTPSDPGAPTVASHNYTLASQDGEINLGGMTALLSAIVRISPYQGSVVAPGTRLYLSGTDRPLKWQGTWSNAYGTYKVNDAVSNNGVSYICILEHDPTAVANDEPGVGASSSTYWEVLALGSSINWRNAWSGASVSYAPLDAVSHDGASYVCILAHTSAGVYEPGVGASWTSVWDVVADKGADGAPGADGSNGSDGADGADGTSINWISGGWTGGTYAVKDALSHNGRSYICIVAHSSAGSTEPGIGASWGTYWELIADQGDPGADGADGSDGAPGADGSPGADGADGAKGMNWIGAWTTSTAYSIDDGVRSSNGRAYICISDHTSSATDEPGVGVNTATYWSLFADRGAGRLGVFDITFEAKAGSIQTILTYTTGTLEYDDGSSYTINYGTRELTFSSASTYYYVYFDPAINTDRFQLTTTRATAVAAGSTGMRVLIGIGRQGSASGQYLQFFPQWGKPIVNEQSMNIGSLAALFASIDLLEIADALIIASGGVIENAGQTWGISDSGFEVTQHSGSGFTDTAEASEYVIKNSGGSILSRWGRNAYSLANRIPGVATLFGAFSYFTGVHVFMDKIFFNDKVSFPALIGTRDGIEMNDPGSDPSGYASTVTLFQRSQIPYILNATVKRAILTADTVDPLSFLFTGSGSDSMTANDSASSILDGLATAGIRTVKGSRNAQYRIITIDVYGVFTSNEVASFNLDLKLDSSVISSLDNITVPNLSGASDAWHYRAVLKSTLYSTTTGVIATFATISIGSGANHYVHQTYGSVSSLDNQNDFELDLVCEFNSGDSSEQITAHQVTARFDNADPTLAKQ